MKVYKVKVNGEVYEVEVEAVDEVKGSIETTTAAAPKAATPASGANTIKAPIAGKILDVKVNVGDNVNKDDTVAIIEAMKMENEIKSPLSGKVADIVISEGDNVNTGDVIIVLE